MSIHIYVWLCIENEEEVSVEEEEETAPPTKTPPVGKCFYFDICGIEPRLPDNTRQAPVHLPFPCDFKLFIT
jgi:hypothetical protein